MYVKGMQPKPSALFDANFTAQFLIVCVQCSSPLPAAMVMLAAVAVLWLIPPKRVLEMTHAKSRDLQI